MNRLTVREWTEDEFASSRQAWQRLLADSDADPLFMSWDWQSRWWHHHASMLDATLRLVAVYDSCGQLVGLAPFYVHRVRLRGPIPCRRIELIGMAWRNPQVVFSEYLDLIAAREHVEAVLAAVGDWLGGVSWQDLVLCCTRTDSLVARLARERLTASSLLREVDPMIGHCVPLRGHFDEYVQRLPADTRRKAFNHRSKLSDPHLLAARPEEISQYFATLAPLVASRWADRWDGGESQTSLQRRFHLDLAAHLAAAGELQLTRLVVAGRTVSVMYNVRLRSTEYYLQSGFDPSLSQGLSIGYLHLGYAIEAAYASGVRRFDLLAGSGRHRDYKRDFLTEPSPLVSFQLVRAPWLRALYGGYEILQRQLAAPGARGVAPG